MYFIYQLSCGFFYAIFKYENFINIYTNID